MMYDNSNYLELESVCYFKAGNSTTLGADIPMHKEVIEILTGGKVMFDIDGKEQVFGTDTMFWHIGGEGTIRKNVLSDPYECLALSFRVKQPPRRQVPRVIKLPQKGIANQLTKDFLENFYNTSVDRKIFGIYAYNRLIWEGYNASIHSPVQRMPRSLRKAIDYIQKRYDKDLLIEDICKASGLSPSYLYRLFKQHLEISPHQYLLEIRLKHARQQLVSSDMPIKQVSDLCGFMNVESFCRNFKKQFKTTPGLYRNKYSPY